MSHDAPRRVKLHIFEPSGRRLWTVVGREDEYWLDPDTSYCSCLGYYFDPNHSCNHLKQQAGANHTTIRFDDSEFEGFVRGLVEHMMR